MKTTLVITIISTLVLPVSAIADRSGHMEMGKQTSGNTLHMESGKQDSTMMKMQDRMKKMIKQMDKIHQTKNSKQRDKLIESHIENMHEGMMEMRNMGGGMMMDMMMGGKKGSGMMSRGKMMDDKKMGKGMTNDQMMMRMGAMQDRMDMMQMMMEQMMQSQQAERSLHQGEHMK